MTQPDKAALADALERCSNGLGEWSRLAFYFNDNEIKLIVAALRSADGMREALEEIVTLYDSGKNAATLCMTAQRALAAPQASP